MDLISAERQQDAFIERRAREARGQGRVEEMWAESVRRDRQRRREEHREAWLEHERHMERLHAALSEEHRARAAALSEEGVS